MISRRDRRQSGVHRVPGGWRPFCAALLLLPAATASAQIRPPDTLPRPAGPRQPAPRQSPDLYRDLARGMSPLPGGFNPEIPGEDFGARNAIVTGNVYSGRGFRETVGYAGPWDFRGETASSEIDRFLADAGPAAAVLTARSSVIDELRFGQQFGVIEFERTFGGRAAIDSMMPVYGETARRQRALDLAAQRGLGTSSVREFGEPVFAGVIAVSPDVRLAVDLSTLRGVRVGPMQGAYRELGLSLSDAIGIERDLALGITPGGPFDVRLPGTAEVTPGAAPSVGDTRPVESRTYRAMQEAVAERFAQLRAEPAPAPAPLTGEDRLASDLDRLREMLASGAPVDPSDPAAFDPLAIIRRADAGADVPPPPPAEGIDAAITRALRHGRVVTELSEADGSRFAELVQAGEQELAAGAYLRAERAFQRALRFAPGHPLGLAGLAHAQIGAGLYQSAALSLRTLFANSPEMIDARFAPTARPPDDRLESVVTELRSRLEIERVRAESAVLLAYVGRLLGRPQIVREGLDRLQAFAPDDALTRVLTAVWSE